MKKTKLFLTTLLLTAAMSSAVFAGEWKQETAGWWYQNEDGTYVADSWMEENGKWYHFNSDGYMQTGWLELSAQWYYLNPSGDMQTSSMTLNDVTYHFNGDGTCQNRWASGVSYYDSKTGTWRSVEAELTERSILDSLTGPLEFEYYE